MAQRLNSWSIWPSLGNSRIQELVAGNEETLEFQDVPRARIFWMISPSNNPPSIGYWANGLGAHFPGGQVRYAWPGSQSPEELHGWMWPMTRGCQGPGAGMSHFEDLCHPQKSAKITVSVGIKYLLEFISVGISPLVG